MPEPNQPCECGCLVVPTLRAENQELRWSVIKAQGERDDAIDAEKIALREIGAVNERLRTALRRAADAPCSHCSAEWAHGERVTAHFIADQALPRQL